MLRSKDGLKSPSNSAETAPFALLAEVTHRCPLRCLYCSNPLELTQRHDELSTEEWLRVIEEAADLGALQIHFSGGEPIIRTDLEVMIQRARDFGFYTNLITSGIGLTGDRMHTLRDSGLDSVQLSLQSSNPDLSDEIAGIRCYRLKEDAAKIIYKLELPLTVNVVLHRLNLEHLEDIIDLCVRWGARRVELANAQYYGWALANRDLLLPSREQLQRAEATYLRKKGELKSGVELIWVLCDYYETFPKSCMGGWGKLQLTVCPNGRVLPCPAAGTISALPAESVRVKGLRSIWYESPTFNKFRGFDWMPEPCRSCDRRFKDFGGCRCQAFALTGDAARTDPVCQFSADRHRIDSAIEVAEHASSTAKLGLSRHHI